MRVYQDILRTAAVVALQPLCLLCLSTGAVSQSRAPRDSVRTYELDSVLVVAERARTPGFSYAASQLEYRSVPAIAGDPVRTLALLPSAVRTSDFQSIPSIAGDDPDRILILFDGIPVQLPIRLMGAFSVFNPLLVKSIEAATTGIPASWGNCFSSGISVQTQEAPQSATIEGIVDLASSSLAAGFPLGERRQWAASAALRASHLDLLSSALPSSARERLETFTPKLRDGFLRISVAPTPAWKLSAQTLLASEDGMLASPDHSFDYSWEKILAHIRSRTTAGRFSAVADLSWSRDVLGLASDIPIEQVGTGTLTVTGGFNTLRGALNATTALGGQSVLTVGAEFNAVHSTLRFASSIDWINRYGTRGQDFGDYALFAEGSLSEPISGVSLTGGIRASYFGLLNRAGIEPRFEALVRPGGGIALTVRYGRYLVGVSNLQFLQGFMSFLATPNQPPRMLMTRANHPDRPEQLDVWGISLSRAVEWDREVQANVTLEGYYKTGRNILQSARYPAKFTLLDSASFEPGGEFRVERYGVGAELQLALTQLGLSLRGSGYFQRSWTIDSRDDRRYSGASDIPFAGKLVITYSPAPLRASITYQYYSGAPTTDRYFLEGTGLLGGSFLIPVDKELNTGELPAYSRVDLSVSFQWEFGEWLVEPYLQIFNAFNASNVSHLEYVEARGQPENVRAVPKYNSLPFLPFLGIRFQR